MSAIWEGVTADILAKAKFRGPVRYGDGQNGMAQQDHECVDNPRFGYSWRRENRKDKGRVFYTVKSSTYEMSRVMSLFATDRMKDMGLKCALGKACRKCEILNTIKATMEERRTRPMGVLSPDDIDDSDIDAAKAMTCIGHVLTSDKSIHVAEGIVWTKEDREGRA